jgi:hypothetical protein
MQLSDLRQVIAELKARPSADLDARVHGAIDAALASEQSPGRSLPFLLNLFMRTPMTKWTAATVTVAALLIGALLLDKGALPAFGIEEVIAAYKGVRSLHIKRYVGETNAEPCEFWIKTDDSGAVVKARYFLPGTEDGDKLVTWTPERVEVWFQTKHGFLTSEGPEVKDRMQSLLNDCQPNLIMARLEQDRKNGKAKVEVQTKSGSQQPTTLIATYEAREFKQVFHIDPQTRLVSAIESYSLKDGKETLSGKVEYLDYNAPIEDKMFSLREELPKDVRIADTLTRVTGVEQYPGMTDEQAAAETAEQFFQALINKDYNKAGSIYSGALEPYAKEEFGGVNVTAIRSIGAAELQTNWMPRGYRVPCELEVTQTNGQKVTWKSAPYMRPGDNRAHLNNWYITGGVNPQEIGIKPLPHDAKYQNLAPQEMARAFFTALAKSDWDEVANFWPGSTNDSHFESMKNLGGLQLISLGEAVQEGKYAGWFVPYEIKISMDVNFFVANTNAARRYVLVGLYDAQLHQSQMVEWDSAPETLPAGDPCANMSPTEVVNAYVTAMTNCDWPALAKLTSENDVRTTRRQAEEAKKAGANLADQFQNMEVLGVTPTADGVGSYVKCRLGGVKKWRLAVRNDNPDHRFFFDGGL